MDESDQGPLSGRQPPATTQARPGRATAIRIEEVHAVGPELAGVIGRLMPQLSRETMPPGEDALTALLADPAVTLLVAWHDKSAVGMAMVAVYNRLISPVAHLEDVVVDEAARGAGIGERLVRTAAAAARTRGASRLELTSSPRRESANRLYQRLGFQRRETNVYRLEL